MAYRLQIHPYFFKSASRSSWDCDFRCDFHPGHHRICHFHSRPRNDWGDLSYFALKEHLSQLLMGFSFDGSWNLNRNSEHKPRRFCHSEVLRMLRCSSIIMDELEERGNKKRIRKRIQCIKKSIMVMMNTWAVTWSFSPAFRGLKAHHTILNIV